LYGKKHLKVAAIAWQFRRMEKQCTCLLSKKISGTWLIAIPEISLKKLKVHKRAHNTIYGPSGKFVYLDDIASPWLYVADAKKHELVNKVGPFANFVRPFTIDGRETLVYATVDSLLGFEVGDLSTGKKLAHVEVEGWNMGPVRRHGNPSHGIALTPDEKEIWLADGHNMRVHVFSAAEPYQQLTTIPVQDMPGWITFSIDGKYVYPSGGEVIETKTRKIISTLQDEFHNSVASEKMVEIDFEGKRAVKAGDQFGIVLFDFNKLKLLSEQLIDWSLVIGQELRVWSEVMVQVFTRAKNKSVETKNRIPTTKPAATT
jgi:hypothetical protein